MTIASRNSVITYMGRLVLKAVLRNVAESGIYRKKMLVVTTSDKVESLVQKAKGELEFNYAISALAIMDKDMIGKEVAGIPVTGSVETLYDDARLTIVDSVLIDLEPDRPQFKETVNLFHVMGVEVNISLADYNLGIPNQQIVKMGELTVLSGNGRTEALGEVIAKRILDIIGGLVGLLITGVLMLIVGPAIMLESPGPILFSQMRVGKNGRRFKIYKFRSMYMDAEERKKELMEKNKMSGLMFKMDDDPRITKVGKFIRKTSIDELPQLVNIIMGVGFGMFEDTLAFSVIGMLFIVSGAYQMIRVKQELAAIREAQATLETEDKEMKAYLEDVIESAAAYAGEATVAAITEAKEVLSDEKFLLQKGLRSLSDKDARVGSKSKTSQFYGYKTELTMTADERIITAADTHSGEYVDGKEFAPLLERTQNAGVTVHELYGDKAYFRKDILEMLEKQKEIAADYEVQLSRAKQKNQKKD